MYAIAIVLVATATSLAEEPEPLSMGPTSVENVVVGRRPDLENFVGGWVRLFSALDGHGKSQVAVVRLRSADVLDEKRQLWTVDVCASGVGAFRQVRARGAIVADWAATPAQCAAEPILHPGEPELIHPQVPDIFFLPAAVGQ